MYFKFSGFIIFLLVFSSCIPIARTLKIIPSGKVSEIKFEEEPSNKDYQFFYADTINNSYLKNLRNDYDLDSMILGLDDDLEKIKVILDWTNKQWEHSGSNVPEKNDALSILKEAEEGKKFRCVEYGIVSTAALSSVGFKTRAIGLKTRDVEKVKFSAGHVAAEVYSQQYGKWIFFDPQFNVIPVAKDIPLNALELQKVIVNNKEDLRLVSLSRDANIDGLNKYIKFIGKHLYYFDIRFDNRIGNVSKRYKYNGFYRLMLVPIGAENPVVFQRKYKFPAEYTHSTSDFYRKPN